MLFGHSSRSFSALCLIRLWRGAASRFVLNAIIVVTIMTVVGGAGASGSESKFRQAPLVPPDVSVELQRKGVVRLILDLGAAFTGKRVTVALLDFVGEDGEAVSVRFLAQKDSPSESGVTSPSDPTKSISFDHHGRRILHFDTSGLKQPGSYIGEVQISAKDTPVETLLLELKQPFPKLRGTASDGVLSINVAEEGSALLTVDTWASGEVRVDFQLSQFVGAQGDLQAIVFVDEAGKPIGERREGVAVEGSTVLSIDASRLRPGETYSGDLTISMGGKPLPAMPLKLTRLKGPQDATLRLEGAASVVRRLEVDDCWTSCAPENLPLLLSEASNQLPIEGVSVISPTYSPQDGSFVPSRDLRITLGRQDADEQTAEGRTGNAAGLQSKAESRTSPNLFGFDPDDTGDRALRSIAAGGHGFLHIAVPELSPGEYKATLRILAENAKLDALPELDLTIQIKYTAIYGIAILLASILASYVATKGLKTLKRRMEFRQEVGSLQRSLWLRRDQSGILPIVQAAATLAQVRKAIDRERGYLHWFSVPNVFEARLAAVKSAAPILERLSALEHRWENSGEHRMIVYRARRIFLGIVRAGGKARLNSDQISALEPRVEALEKWEDRTELEARYWASIKKSVDPLLSKVNIDLLTLAEVAPLRKRLEALVKDLDPEPVRESANRLSQEIKSQLGSLPQSDRSAVVSELDSLVRELDAGLAWMAEVKGSLDKALDLVESIDKDGISEIDGEIQEAEKRLAAVPPIELRAAVDKAVSASPDAESATAATITSQANEIDRVESLPKRLQDQIAATKNDLDVIRRSDRQLLLPLVAALDMTSAPKDLSAAIEVDERYATLKILWDQYENDKSKFEKLLEMYRQGKDLRDLFDTADNWIWEQLKSKKSEITIERPGSANLPPKAYELIDLEVDAKDPAIARSYLFNHGLEYHWTIVFGTREEDCLTPKTREPRVSQFIPLAVDKKVIKVSVEIRFARAKPAKEPILVERYQEFGVRAATEFASFKAFQWVEMTALSIATLVALVAGMKTDLFEEFLSSGSVQSMLGLAVWGLAADQAKNLIQTIGTYTGASATQ